MNKGQSLLIVMSPSKSFFATSMLLLARVETCPVPFILLPYVRSMHQSSNSLYFGISVLLVWWSRHAGRAHLAFGLQQQACEASSSMNETERYFCVSLESHCRLCRNRVVFKLNKMFVQRRLIGHCVYIIYSSFFLWPYAMSVRGHW